MADVPIPKDNKEELAWNQYFNGEPVVYEALEEKDNKDTKPRQHGKRSDVIRS